MKSILLIVLLSLSSYLAAQKIPTPKNFRPSRVPNFTRTLAQQQLLNKTGQLSWVKQKAVQRKLQSSISTIRLPTDGFSIHHWENPRATTFVIKEIYKGKEYLWGVTATHYSFKNPILTGSSSEQQESPIRLVAQGHPEMNDISLFPIPPQMQKKFTPLPLAKQTAQLGEELLSAGYFNDEFHIEPNRTVIDKTPHQLVTSLKVRDKLSREGACGGPVLNKQGEVVGIHVGSSKSKQAGFLVPVEHIYELLYAFHHQGKALRPFYFKGRKLGDININEHITSIQVWHGSTLLEEYLSYLHRHTMDYDHLENLVNASGADRIIFTVERIPFSMVEKDQSVHKYEITYNLTTFRISKRRIR